MKSFRMLIPAIGMVILILDAPTALAGTQAGLELCIRSVIPSLLPFLFLSTMLTGSTPSGLLRPLGRLCRIPDGAETILTVGLLGGYPVGAQAVAQAYDDGRLDRESAQRMLGFCSNGGPAFLFGMLGSCFDLPVLWFLWTIHILSALITGILLPGGGCRFLQGQNTFMSPVVALERSLKTMALICGWVTVFRVGLAFLRRWFLWMLPKWADILISGILELTNGCCQLPMADNQGLQFILASAMLAFGGICVAMQTASVVKDLGIGSYLTGKLIQTAVSVTLAYLIQGWIFPQGHCLPVNYLLPMGLCLIIFLFTKNTVAFCRGRVYNERKSTI